MKINIGQDSAGPEYTLFYHQIFVLGEYDFDCLEAYNGFWFMGDDF